MTSIVDHRQERTDWRHVRHTYLVDVGTVIDIPMMDVSKLYENCILDPPYTKIRYFEVEIDEQKNGGQMLVLFQNIFPVHAQREPDLRFLRFLIRRGGWTVTERIHFPTDTGEAQWLYTDDFNILFLSSGGRHDLDMLVTLITGKLNTIARSFDAGNPIPSEFENQLSCRNAIDSIFAEGVDRAFRDAAVYQDFGLIEPGTLQKNAVPLPGSEITLHHGRAPITAEKARGLHVDISEIEDLRDLSWLSN